jgi:hypothetical protein
MTISKSAISEQHRFLRAYQQVQEIARIFGAEATFNLIEEVQTTGDDRRDDCDADGNIIGWTCTPARPFGPGWAIKDDSSDRKTVSHRWVVNPGNLQ